MQQHLADRGLDVRRYSSVYVDQDRATFALWNLSGQMVGYQVYRPDMPKNGDGHPRDQRYYTFVSRYGAKTPQLAVWGIETLRPGAPVFLVEGVFDACKLHNLGLAAVATLGSDPQHLCSWLKCLPCRKVALVEGDSAGKKLAKYGDEAMFLPLGKDAGDMNEQELAVILDRYL
ncbi:MAG: hypothetical protein JWP38_3679 [Herbaspirillum sp.]|nr:hypothetical protein [Herbaspirillum sp.]